MSAPAPVSVSGPAKVFEEALARESIKSERLRATILAALFFVIGAVAPAVGFVLRDELARVSEGRLRPELLVVLVAGAWSVSAFELVSRYAAGRVLASGARLPTLPRYGNALVETTIPTVALLFAAQLLGPLNALASPPAFLYFVFIALSALRLDPRLSLFTGGAAALQYAAVAAWATRTGDAHGAPFLASLPQHLAKAAMLAVTGGVTALVSGAVRRHLVTSLTTLAERNRILDLFGQHVSPTVVERLLRAPSELEGETRHVCVMFLDIRGFTTYAERRPPAEVVAYLNELWALAVDVVTDHGGIVNKFLGDGFMALFGAPEARGDDCKHAVSAARAIVARVASECARGKLPATRVGIGLHAGEVVTGSVGSRRRREYTVIGDVVNVASRIEQLTKRHAAQILASREVLAGWRDEADATSLGAVELPGRAEPVELFKLD